MVNNVSNSNLIYTLTESQIEQLAKANPTKAEEIKQYALGGFDASELTLLGQDIAAAIVKDGNSSSGEATTTTDVDPLATTTLRNEIRLAQAKYKDANASAEDIADEIESRNKKMEDAQDAFKKAVEQLGDDKDAISKSVDSQMGDIIALAKSGKLTKTQAQEQLKGISIPGIDTSKIEGLEDDINSLATALSDLSDAYSLQAATVDGLAEKYGDFLTTDIANISVDTTGKITISQVGTGPDAITQTGPETGVSAADMAKMASMSNEDLAKALSGGDASKNIPDFSQVLTMMNSSSPSAAQNLNSEEGAAVLKKLIAENKQTGSGNFGTKGNGAEVNLMNGISIDKLKEAAKCEQDKKTPPKSCDPYEITIDGKTYEFIMDNGDGKWNTADIFGINDTKDNIFASMKTADINKDGSISGEELSKMGIRLVEKKNGKLMVDDPSKDFDLSKVDSISTKSFEKSNDNDGNVGTFGTFDMKLKDGRLIEGKQTFEEMSTLQKLFTGAKGFVNNAVENVKSALKLDPETVKLYAGAGKIALDEAKNTSDYGKYNIEIANSTLSSLESYVSSASSAGYGKDEKGEKQQPQKAVEPEPTAPQKEQQLKKKKPEEV